MAACAIWSIANSASCARRWPNGSGSGASPRTSSTRCASSCPGPRGCGRAGCCASASSSTTIWAAARRCRRRGPSTCAAMSRACRCAPASPPAIAIRTAGSTTPGWSCSMPATRRIAARPCGRARRSLAWRGRPGSGRSTPAPRRARRCAFAPAPWSTPPGRRCWRCPARDRGWRAGACGWCAARTSSCRACSTTTSPISSSCPTAASSSPFPMSATSP